MELLREIYESELGFGERSAESNRHGGRFWFSRLAVGVIYNEEYRIALIRREDGKVELPIGPSGSSEDPLAGFRQELAAAAVSEPEEKTLLSLTLSEKQELGLVIEYLDGIEFIRFAYGYTARASGRTGEQARGETDDAAVGVVWLPPREAIATMQLREPKGYEEKFIQARDLALLKHLLLHR